MRRNNNDIDIYRHLTQDELVDYSTGVLGSDEMYRLELHLNECEFCNDALDGISLLNNPKEVLGEINTKINPTHQSSSTVNYLAIAASITLVSLIGISYWFFTKPIAETSIAINEAQEIREEPSLEAVEKPIEEDATNEIVIEDLPQEPINSIATSTPPTITDQQKVAEIEESADSQKQKIIVSTKEIENPEPATSIASADFGATDDALLDTQEEVVEPEQELAGEIGLSEVVQSAPRTTSKFRKKEARRTPSNLKDQKEPIPIGGMVNLKTYIDTNLKYPQEAIDNNIKGTVVIKVSVNIDGSFNNISIIKGLGYGCDAEAMRLISTGPTWTPQVENGVAVKGNRQIKIKFKQ